MTVLYEIDDYVKAARKIKSHELSEMFDRRARREMELAMRAADGIICSTDYLARRYRIVQPAHLGVPERHRPQPLRQRPDRHDGVTIGWAGGVGHKASLARWEPALRSACAPVPRRASCPSATWRPATTSRSSARERAIALPARRRSRSTRRR